MKLKIVTLESDIKRAFAPLDVDIEIVNNNLRSIRIKNGNNVVAVISREGTYSDNIGVMVAETKTQYSSQTNLCGAEIRKDFDNPQDRDTWENEIVSSAPHVELTFKRSESVVPA